MVLRSLAKVVVAAGEAVTKAFAKAVKEELTSAQQAAARQAAASGSSSKTEEQEATKANAKLGISLQESVQILDVKQPLDREQIEKRFKHLFEINDKSKGGSFYLQSKVYCAKQRIDEELRRLESKDSKEQESG